MKTVDIFLADIREFQEDTQEVLSRIAPCYVKKHRAHKIEKDARQELVCGWMLREYLGIERDDQIFYNEFQKPYLVSKEKFFNLSHSEDYVALAVADCEVGIDVEKLRPYHEATVKKVFSTRQREELSRLEGVRRDECFTRMWTVCEAMLKLKGTGFGEEWDKESGPVEKCSIRTETINEYMLSCATEEKADVVIHFC